MFRSRLCLSQTVEWSAWLFLVLGLLMPVSTAFASEGKPQGLDAEEPSGLVLEPYVFEDGVPVERLEPEDFQVRMVDADDPEQRVLDFPAGEAFLPPPGRFRVWLEGPEWMTPFTDLLVVRGLGPHGHRSRKMPVVPAGTVLPPEGFRPTDEVRLLYGGEDSQAGTVRLELTRRVVVSSWPEGGVRMPEGPLIAAVWRPEDERYVAVSRPLTVKAGELLSPSFLAPKPDAGHLLAYVERGVGTKPTDVSGLSLRLDYPGRSIEPDLVVPTNWGAYALWYDLLPGPVSLVGKSDELVLPETKVLVQEGGVVRLGAKLVRSDLE